MMARAARPEAMREEVSMAEKYTIGRTELPYRPSTVQNGTRKSLSLMEPSAMRLHHSIRRARIAAMSAVLAASAVSASAQNGQSSFSVSLQNALAQSAAQTAAQPQTESVRRLSIDEAVTLAMEQNLGIRIQRFDPQISDIGVWQARSFWAPSLSSTVSKNSNHSPVTSSLSGTLSSLATGNFSTGLTLAETLPWGANYAVN